MTFVRFVEIVIGQGGRGEVKGQECFYLKTFERLLKLSWSLSDNFAFVKSEKKWLLLRTSWLPVKA